MEASETVEQAPSGEQTQEQAPAPDYAALQTQLTELAPSLDALRGVLEETRTQQQQEEKPEEAEQEIGPPDLSFLSPEQPAYDETQAAELLGRVIQDNVEQRTKQALGPLQERLDDMQLQREADALSQEFPELKENPEAVESVFRSAEKYAEQAGYPELASSVPFVRLVYMAGRMAELANEERSETVKTATLEGAGGASPGAPSVGRAEDALLSGGRRNPLPF